MKHHFLLHLFHCWGKKLKNLGLVNIFLFALFVQFIIV